MSGGFASPAKYLGPLTDHHDRGSFTSGNPDLDRYFHHQAGQDAKRNLAAPFVMIDQSGAVVGYYTLSNYSLFAAELPIKITKKLPKYPLFPATLLGRLAVSQKHQGQGFGQILLMDAFHRALRLTAEMGSLAVVVEAHDDKARAFYQHHQLQPIDGEPNKLFILMKSLEAIFADVK